MSVAPEAAEVELEDDEEVFKARRERMSKSKEPVVPFTQHVVFTVPPQGRQHHLPSGQGLRA